MTVPDGVVIGVDIGTSTVKAAAVDGSGVLRGSAQRATRWTRASDQREQLTAATVLDDVLTAIADVIAVVSADLGSVAVHGLGLAGLGESGFLLDPRGAPVGPALPWFDTRGAREMASLAPQLGDQFAARTGLKVGPQCTVAKLLWMRGQGMETGPGYCWLNVPEYVAHALGASRTTEPSLASRTGLLDQGTGAPWSDILDAAGMTSDMLPVSVPAGLPTGVVTAREAPSQLRGATVTIAGHDHCVAAVGAGAFDGEQLFNSYGTADVLLRSVNGALTDRMRSDLVARGVEAGQHNLPGRSALVTGTRGGLLLQRTLQWLGATDAAARDALDRSLPVERAGTPTPAATVDSAEDGSLRVTAADDATQTDVWQAALATVTVEAARRTEAIDHVVGPHSSASASGGWTTLRSVRAARRRAIPHIAFGNVAEPGALGAALFASYAASGAPGDVLDFIKGLAPARGTAGTNDPHHRHREVIHD